MPKLLYTIKTPLGEFASSGQAGRAHKCDRGVILKRCETDPENYQKIPKPPAPPRKHEPVPVTNTTWPLTWAQYKWLSYETKEEIWENWCRTRMLNPDLESTVDKFFDEMDQTAEGQDE